jgi:predicted nucleic acid-binding protein
VILLDSNVVIDLLGDAEEWFAWSWNSVEEAGLDNDLAISPIVVAEVAPYLGGLDDFVERVSRFGATVVDLTNEAAYAAGSAFITYRERRREKPEVTRSIIADFLIGGQALVLGATIITRDSRFYRSYFPSVPLITPDKAEP